LAAGVHGCCLTLGLLTEMRLVKSRQKKTVKLNRFLFDGRLQTRFRPNWTMDPGRDGFRRQHLGMSACAVPEDGGRSRAAALPGCK
jgi:hypothetical protein